MLNAKKWYQGPQIIELMVKKMMQMLLSVIIALRQARASVYWIPQLPYWGKYVSMIHMHK
jgi:hypothetical protein